MAATYEPIATTTLSTTVAEVTFTSIPGTYTDLVLVCSMRRTTAPKNLLLQYNNDTGNNYSLTYIDGGGTTASSGRNSNADANSLDYSASTTNYVPSITHIMNYSNTTTYKTLINRSSDASTNTVVHCGLWRSTSAITSIKLFVSAGTTSIASDSTFTLYGIKAA